MTKKKILYFLILMAFSPSFYAAPAYADCEPKTASNLVAKNAIIIDKDAHLAWTRCALGMEWQEQTKICEGQPQGYTHEEAVRAAEALGAGWHLPTGAEMETLLKHSCNGALTKHKLFPNLIANDVGDGANFWTASEAAPHYYYYFNLTNGQVDYHSAQFSLTVLAVKSLDVK